MEKKLFGKVKMILNSVHGDFILIATISGELPVRMGGPQVPTPLVV
jgi:hypothetical protein